MSETNHAVETPPPPPHQHESRDADLRKLTYAALGILALVIFGFIVTEIVFHIFVVPQKVRPPRALFTAAQMPPPPRLQEHVGAELQDYLRAQNHVLDTYGWVNRKAGVVRVPISRAMALLLQQGLPVRKPGQMTLAPSAPHELPRGDFAPPPQPVPGPRHQ
ncbi:MAG: hypothetical protein ACRD3O_11190 [Terriglobia bacterium]